MILTTNTKFKDGSGGSSKNIQIQFVAGIYTDYMDNGDKLLVVEYVDENGGRDVISDIISIHISQDN